MLRDRGRAFVLQAQPGRRIHGLRVAKKLLLAPDDDDLIDIVLDGVAGQQAIGGLST
jgi:hypothetical protein